MDGVELLARARAAGLEVKAEDGRLVVRGPKSAAELAQELLAHKAEVIVLLQAQEGAACLPEPGALVEELERLLRLGQRLRAGHVKAIRCGITGKLCRACAGVPCWGSVGVNEGE